MAIYIYNTRTTTRDLTTSISAGFYYVSSSSLSEWGTDTEIRTKLILINSEEKKEKANGFTHIKDRFPHCDGGSCAFLSLLHWSPFVLENLRYRPRYPQQQANRSTRYFLYIDIQSQSQFILSFFNYPFLLSFSFLGLSQIVMEAQKSVGWYHDEADSGLRATNRKLLLHHDFSKRFRSHALWGFF